jgi:predicted kinase
MISSTRHINILSLRLCLLSTAFGMQIDQPIPLDNVIQEHKLQLHNLDKIHKPLLILFSATPGMGKTTIAKQLEDEFSAIRITLDEGRILMKKYNLYPITGTEQDKIDCIMNYANMLLRSLQKTSKNQFIILDASVDRMYSKISAIAAEHQFPTFLIQVKTSKKTAIRRIKAREKNPEGYLANIDRWYKDYLAFDSKYIDYSIENDVDGKEPVMRPLFNLLKTRYKLI